MRVIVIGGGIVGVASAYYLRRAGCSVTVVERNAGVAHEASFGHAGVLSSGLASPWAAPGMPARLARQLFSPHSALRFSPRLDPALWRWLLRWLGECRLERYRQNRVRMQGLASMSRALLHQIAAEHNLDYQRAAGVLQLYRHGSDRAKGESEASFLKDAGIEHTLFDAAECRKVEPGLSELAFQGGLYLPADEVGNCPLFARQLRDISTAEGVEYRFGLKVEAIDAAPGEVRLNTSAGELLADAVVVAGGVDSPALLAPLGIRVPLYPVKGYSATVPIRETIYAPHSALVDDSYQVAITRLGNRLRIAGLLELGSRQLGLRESALRTLIKVARDWFPGAADYRLASYWVGARPMLPEGAPLLGATKLERVFINLGHGSNGWAMACGSGKLIADAVTGRPAGAEMDGLTLARCNRKKN